MAASRTLQRQGGVEEPAYCPRYYMTTSHWAGPGSGALTLGQETHKRLDKGCWQPFSENASLTHYLRNTCLTPEDKWPAPRKLSHKRT